MNIRYKRGAGFDWKILELIAHALYKHKPLLSQFIIEDQNPYGHNQVITGRDPESSLVYRN